MGNVNRSSSSSNGNGNSRRRNRNNYNNSPPAPPQPPQTETTGNENRFIFAAATPFPPQYPDPNSPQYYQYTGFYPPPPPTMPVPLPAPLDNHHRVDPTTTNGNWVGGRFPVPPPYVEHQKAVTIHNDVNLKKETLKLIADEDNPGYFLVTFTFDATVSGW